MRRHIIIVAIGSAGDVHPLAALGEALMHRGNRVTLLANGHFSGLAATLGLEFAAVGSDADYQLAMQNPELWHPRRGLAAVWSYTVPSLDFCYDWIAANAEPGTVLVGSTLAFGARIAHDRLGLPLVTVHLAPSVLMSAEDPPQFAAWRLPHWLPASWVAALWSLIERWRIDPLLAPAVNATRTRAGLPPTTSLLRNYIHSPQRVLLLYPEWFAADPGDRPANSVCVGFPRFDERGLHRWPEGLRAFLAAGEPPLLFTPGSAMQHARGFFERAIASCEALGRRGIIVTRYTAQVPQLPLSMLRVDYVPFSELLPHVALIAHHGGIGTCAQALAAGVPQLVVPNAHDQFDNGARLRHLGVGDWLPQHVSFNRFAQTIARLLHSVTIRNRCQHWQKQMQEPEAVLDAACQIIDALAPDPQSA